MKRHPHESRWNPNVELQWHSYVGNSDFQYRHDTLEAFQEFGRTQAAEFSEELGRIDSLVVETHPLSLIACFSAFFLTSLLPNKRIDKNVPIVQAHGELLQAFLLRHRLDEFTWREHPSLAIDPIGRCIASLTRAFSERRLSNLVSRENVEQSAQQLVTEFMRASTQLVRNWGHSYQTFGVLERLFAPLDADLVRACGAKAADILRFWTNITKHTEDGLTGVVDRVRRARSEPSGQLFLKRIAREFGFPDQHVERIRRIARNAGKERSDEVAFFMCLELLLPSVFLFGWDQLRSMCPESVTDTSMRSLLERWSYLVLATRFGPFRKFILAHPLG